MKLPAWKYPVHALALGFGTGLVPRAPGTFGTLVGVVAFWLMASLAPIAYAGVVLVLFVAGVFICGQAARDMGRTDPGAIVYDEIVGFLVAMFMIPATGWWILAGFVLFRLFDIWKPFPIRTIERRLGPGLGIMVDDVVAGLYALGVLHGARYLLERA